MQNFQLLENESIQTPFGVFAGVTSHVCYPTGELEGLTLSEKNMMVTHIGELIPFYSETERRKNKYSVEFYKSGTVKAVSLDSQQEVTTPIGEFPAELVTFYESGELSRLFPLDGKISGFWSEEDERNLHIPLGFDLGFSRFTARIGAISFFQNGGIRSITLFPGDTIEVSTAYGSITARNGFSLYESGELASVEPEAPVQINTPIGTLTAFDPNAIGISADTNSLEFYPEGTIKKLTVLGNTIAVQTSDSQMEWFHSRKIPHPLEDESEQLVGIAVSFDSGGGAVEIKGDRQGNFVIKDCGFTVGKENAGEAYTCSPADCASCSLCGKGASIQ
ncbi:MAG: hypothetical protein LBQ48_00390 [Oscillospiraceae bacterium]|jgi:hypothetical protein|nr:hypothetical protein [Oscillospiraceae bacterium]